ncbi:MAG: A-macroglobulin complement component, partial [Planctomycetes bacterium]|nr:A-macroglobulin complement component [Planctomycetota bacterium]
MLARSRFTSRFFRARPRLTASLSACLLALGAFAMLSISEVDAKSKSEQLGGTTRYLTYLTSDKPIYRAGEKVYLRGVVLSAHDHTPNTSAFFGSLEILDPAGAKIHTTSASGYASTLGFAWSVPEGSAGGEYTAKVSYPQMGWALAERKFDIRAYRNARITSQMEFAKKAYGPGEEVYASVNVKRAEGGIPAGAKATAIARVDGQEVWRGET